jgi:alpha/beta superfamily hydrolase
VKIPVQHGHLEALLKEPKGAPRGAAVVCHPHPLFGGTMHTKAVYRTAQALTEAGLVALRFNFRGVGSSTGSYEGGVGERDDVRAAIGWLEDRYARLPLVAGGFSFGSMVGLSVGAEDVRIAGLVGLGLPVDRVANIVSGLGPHVTLVRVPGSDHFFTGRLDELRAAVRGYFESGPGAELLVP